jgi:hypothetical protein
MSPVMVFAPVMYVPAHPFVVWQPAVLLSQQPPKSLPEAQVERKIEVAEVECKTESNLDAR